MPSSYAKEDVEGVPVRGDQSEQAAAVHARGGEVRLDGAAQRDAPALHPAIAIELERREGHARLARHDRLGPPVAVEIGDQRLILIARARAVRGEARRLGDHVEAAALAP